jgi:Flp pilus assembly protein TadD
MGSKRAPESRDERDARQWDAIGEASELLVEKNYEAALLELKRITLDDPNNAYAYNLLGTAFWELRQLEAARDAYRAAVLLAPSFLGARTALAQTLRRMGDFAGAEREARMALRQEPRDGDAHMVLGLIFAARGERKKAREHLAAFLESKPEYEAQVEAQSVLELLASGEEGEPLDLDEEGDDA